MRMYPSNCLIAALAAFISSPAKTRIRFSRNVSGRWHCTWTKNGCEYEFYAKGRSQKSYLQNIVYIGRVRKIT
jgi:hypothetical protein